MSTQPQFTGYYHADIPLGAEDTEVTRGGAANALAASSCVATGSRSR